MVGFGACGRSVFLSGFFFGSSSGFGHHGVGDAVAGASFIHLSALWSHVYKVRSFKVFHSKHAEDEVHDGSGGADVGVSRESRRFKTSEGEAVDVLLEGNSVLETNRDCDCETVEETSVGSAFFEGVDEDFSEFSIVVFSRSEEHFLSSDARFYGDSTAFWRKSHLASTKDSV